MDLPPIAGDPRNDSEKRTFSNPRLPIDYTTVVNNIIKAELSGDASANGSDLPLVEGEDYYLDNGLYVFTANFLLRRGYCCDSGCRHCPYSKESNE